MLWDVTDKDIDRYATNLLESWRPRSSSTDRDLLFNVIESRKACSFRYLIGAAPVVYGFPVVLKESDRELWPHLFTATNVLVEVVKKNTV